MKKVFSILVILLSVINQAGGQDLYPQLWFYSNTSPVSEKSMNEVEEHDNLNLEIMLGKYFGGYSDKQMIDMLYRVYEIENTSEIKYSTADWEKLPFLTEESNSIGVEVDFGATLIKNEETDQKGEYKLRFGSPIKIVDPSVFSKKIMKLEFPQCRNLIYKSSPDIRVDWLTHIKGPDVIDNTMLIDKNKTLIVAATFDEEHLKSKKSIIVPNEVIAIGSGAFRGCGVSSIILPSSVKSIGENAFDETKLLHLFIESEVFPNFDKNIFGSCENPEMFLYVPQKLLKNYRNVLPSFSKRILPIEKNRSTLLYFRGLRAYDEKLFPEALMLFEEAAKLGSSEANYQLGKMYLGAKGVEQDAKLAHAYFEKAAKKNHVESMFMCYNYPRYWCHPADLKTATKWLKLALKHNYRAAAFQLGHIYSDVDHNGYPLKLGEALKAYKDAYEISDGDTYAEKNIRRVEKLIELNADKCMEIKDVDMTQYNLNSSASFLFDQFLGKKFCLYDMVIVLMKEYDVNEDQALLDCKQLVEKWKNLGIVAK